MASITKRKSKYSVVYDYYDEEGVRHQKWETWGTYAEAKRRKAEIEHSIKKHGVLTPAVVRKKDDGRYELISGHRRKKACEIAGIDFLPAVVREMDRDESIIFMVDSNLQREKLLPSEKAFSYKMRLEAMNRKAGRPSRENLTQVGSDLEKRRTNEELGAIVGESREQIRRYVRLTELIPPLLDMVDDKRIAFNPAVELSYLPIELQTELYDVIEAEECTPSLSQAQRMHCKWYLHITI